MRLGTAPFLSLPPGLLLQCKQTLTPILALLFLTMILSLRLPICKMGMQWKVKEMWLKL